jgi:hypothetical protein
MKNCRFRGGWWSATTPEKSIYSFPRTPCAVCRIDACANEIVARLQQVHASPQESRRLGSKTPDGLYFTTSSLITSQTPAKLPTDQRVHTSPRISRCLAKE